MLFQMLFQIKLEIFCNQVITNTIKLTDS